MDFGLLLTFSLLVACEFQSNEAFAPEVCLFTPKVGAKLHWNGDSLLELNPYRRGRFRLSLAAADNKWDNLEDTNEGDFDGPPVKPDMKYLARNALRQNKHFLDIRQAGGVSLTHDVYVRALGREPDVFWFVGKVARISDVSLEACVARQWNLIEMHAANLRPIELFPYRHGRLELWTAPGDSEMDVAYNNPNIIMTKMEREVPGADDIKNSFVGFQGEVYERGEQGFRTWRTGDGRPARPQIQSPATSDESNSYEEDDPDEFRAPTEEEMKQIQQALEGRDINDLYEEQQRQKQQATDP